MAAAVEQRWGRAAGWLLAVVAMATAAPALAQTAPGAPVPAGTPPQPHDSNPPTTGGVDSPVAGQGTVRLAAALTADMPPLRGGVVWRIFRERADPNGGRALVAQSEDAQPSVTLPDGRYIVHVAYGFASAIRSVTVADRVQNQRLNLNAGALEVNGSLGDRPITPDKLSLSIYVPERGNAEARLVMAGAKPGQVIRLPEGLYHVVSTFLDTVGVGSLTPVTNTNSIVSADLRVQAGKLVEATVRHRAAVLTLKLVNQSGGEALANTSFTILTPGGDIIRELIGAFPSLVLAEGDYLVIARHNGKTFQSEFKVESALDRDVEVLAQSQN